MSNFHSLKKNSDFHTVYNHKRSAANRSLVMYFVENPENQENKINRIGISVSKRVGNSVVRHRIKRVVREIFRLNDAMFRKGLDIVIVARVEASRKDYRELEAAVMQLAERLGLKEKI